MERELQELPWELIIEIFSRLPVKSLMRFRSVSKSCYSLVTQPLFMNKHLQNTHNPKHAILSHTRIVHKHLVSCPLSSLSDKPIEDAVKVVYPMKDICRCVRLSNSCDGLFCIEVIGNERVMFLWNPSTRESKRLPKSTIEIPDDTYLPEHLFGITNVLGFDSLNNDYKVLRVVDLNDSETDRIDAEVYSLKNNCWRKIDESRMDKWSDPSPDRRRSRVSWTQRPFSCYKYVNGAVHWFGAEKSAVASPKIGAEKSAVASSKIFCLDLSTEIFGEVTMPNNDIIMQIPHKGLEIDLAVLSGMLCVYCNLVKQSFILWAMRKYGSQESWEKIFDIPYDTFDNMPYTRFRMDRFFVPLYMFENGEILLEDCTGKGYAVVTYNRNRVGLKKVVARGLTRITYAHVYLDTLVSPLA